MNAKSIFDIRLYPPMRYNAKEIKLLIDMLKDYLLELDDDDEYEYVNSDEEYPLVDYFSYITEPSNLAAYEENATDRQKAECLYYMATEHQDVYDAMYVQNLDSMPLLINDEKLATIAKWRLQIAK